MVVVVVIALTPHTCCGGRGSETLWAWCESGKRQQRRDCLVAVRWCPCSKAMVPLLATVVGLSVETEVSVELLPWSGQEVQR